MIHIKKSAGVKDFRHFLFMWSKRLVHLQKTKECYDNMPDFMIIKENYYSLAIVTKSAYIRIYNNCCQEVMGK